MPEVNAEPLNTNAEVVVVPETTELVKVCDPVPEVNAKAVEVVLFPIVMVFALAPVPIFMAPVVAESIAKAPEESTIV